jgi:ubiquinone/menaquinone biosynthesis C-methylase UbiE
MTETFSNVYEDADRARAYAQLDFPATYYLAFRDLPMLVRKYVSGLRALDFGCGTGRSTRFLRDLGFAVTGVDVSQAMLEQARGRDPRGDYRWIGEAGLAGLGAGTFDLVLAAFTFDNVPDQQKTSALPELRRLLAPGGRLLVVVSSAAIYRHEWASFSTRDYPENRSARDGDSVRIVMLDVPDRRPVVDVLCSDRHYRELFEAVGLSVVDALSPVASGAEAVSWVSETTISPWTIYVLG